MIYKRKTLFIVVSIIIIAILALAVVFLVYFPKKKSSIIKINNKEINIEIAKNMFDQYQGLSNRDDLCSDCGMLFIFSGKENRDFVMRKMHFSLDILFILDDKIIKIDEKLKPEGIDNLTVYSSIVPVDKVLELNGGYCQENNISIGDKIILD